MDQIINYITFASLYERRLIRLPAIPVWDELKLRSHNYGINGDVHQLIYLFILHLRTELSQEFWIKGG